MPQPIGKKIGPLAYVIFGSGGEDAITNAPDLAALAMRCIASWTSVDYMLMLVYVRMLGGPEDKASTAYLALETQSAKTSVITAVGRRFLEPKVFRLLTAILAIAKTNQKSRDKLAHHLWGWDNRLPNALLLGDPRDLVTGEGLRDCVFVYEKPDLEGIIAANKRLFHFLSGFHMFLDKHPAYEDGSKFDRLCDEPEIRERLDRLA
ncbi:MULTISPECIES: hypothetical protein [unclassified Mesorhizobium]|uniref:hypothetical protein n=1 Tax=unclassified Mesorhizobium TaxID=325217 RepID=UPI000FCAA02A|nr:MULTISPECIES: hypothetical protein [unclassified Mesorhizobium]TIT76583.1 MAG: hypothetical protein E5W57_18460 [Mesorhizobium sp.]TGP17968.1 hypothetical protein EN874_031615 [Mesorhizobium sp. M1D.F.Ca.ET.231.01.1.1]TGP24614.1 hypothetical protein EN877_31155 [Mesorhizobium sp. M1D.F.Ca.ET.234.01.1.1]TGS36913.1 hypothetical protein EN827_31615 [Mesorhizobium sp. M1D.F.Ca.ET.184.01.1.1]TGS57983.1 hypothetical protein EN826_031585 [Mesorhizobium sp. M1D.F.Ca.ET.183.01.1.1]